MRHMLKLQLGSEEPPPWAAPSLASLAGGADGTDGADGANDTGGATVGGGCWGEAPFRCHPISCSQSGRSPGSRSLRSQKRPL